MTSSDKPGYTPTVLEDGAVAMPRASMTVLDTGGGTVMEDGAYIHEAVTVLPTERFNGFEAVERLSSASTEAEVLLAKHPETGEKRVVKWYYNVNHRPAQEVLDQLREMDLHHIPRLYGHGYSRDGRFFELLEFIEGGSLADLIPEVTAKKDEVLAMAIVTEITAALEHLAAHGITHRDLKPDNILIRNRDPLDLVLVDFGLARVTSGNLHKTKLGETTLYSPPEGGKFVHRNRDWWSLGIIVVKLRMGQHPWEALDDDQITLNKNTLPAPIPDEIGATWVMLAKGLLTRDPEKRWSLSEVKRWLNGETDIPIHFETKILEIDTRPCFTDHERGRKMYSLMDVAAVLASADWSANERFLARTGLTLSDWFKNVGKPKVAATLEMIMQDPNLPPCGKVVATIWLLDENDELGLKSEGNLCLRGVTLNEQDASLLLSAPQELHLSISEARSLIGDSAIGNWQQQLTGKGWWNKLMKRRKMLLEVIKQRKLEEMVRIDIAEKLSLASEASLMASARNIRQTAVFSPEPEINKILQSSGELPLEDAWLLSCVNPNLLLDAGGGARFQMESRFAVLAPILNAFTARNYDSCFMLRPPKPLFTACAFGLLSSLLWAVLQGEFSQMWLSAVFLWLVVIPSLGAVVLWQVTSRSRALLKSNENSPPVPATTIQWDELIQERMVRWTPKLGNLVNDENAARREWTALSTDCLRINSKLGLADKIPIPHLPKSGLMNAPVLFQFFVLAAFFIPPQIHKTAEVAVIGRQAARALTPTAPSWNPFQSSSAKSELSFPGERFPETRTSQLTVSQLNRWSVGDLQDAINEMFARHGADFAGKLSTKRHFQQFSWYQPRPGVSYDEIEMSFSAVEKANLILLATVRDSKKSRR